VKVMDSEFRNRLAEGKYTRRYANLNDDHLVGLLWLLGEFACRSSVHEFDHLDTAPGGQKRKFGALRALISFDTNPMTEDEARSYIQRCLRGDSVEAAPADPPKQDPLANSQVSFLATREIDGVEHSAFLIRSREEFLAFEKTGWTKAYAYRITRDQESFASRIARYCDFLKWPSLGLDEIQFNTYVILFTPGKPPATNPDSPKEETDADRKLAEYIIEFLTIRNGGELEPAFDKQRVMDRRLMLGELAMILANGGRPPNWVKR